MPRRSPGCVRPVGTVLALGVLIALGGCALKRVVSPSAATAPKMPTPISMTALHQSGGVPRGWRLSPPPGDAAAGRKDFVEFGCFSCHTVQGEQFPEKPEGQNTAGPDLTGMGAHHPADYFVESILNPSAVLVDGPGYIGPDGASIMPSYPDMTLAQLADLVAYLKSLNSGGTPHTDSPGLSCTAGPRIVNSSFFVQAFEVDSNTRLDEFADWIDQEHFRDYPGLVSIDTYAGRSGKGYLLLCVFGFEDDYALAQFMKGLEGTRGRQPTGGLVSPADHYLLRSAPVYKATLLSVP